MAQNRTKNGNGEQKAERFKRLAESRVNKCLNSLRVIGNLANRHNYSYTEAQVQEVFRVLGQELATAKKKFALSMSDEQKRFKLPEG